MEEQIHYFIEYLAGQGRYSANTLAAYRNDLLQLHQFVSAERPHISSWGWVDTLLLQAFLLQMKARAYSAASIARKIAAIKCFYFYLFEHQVISANPAQTLEAPSVPKRLPVPMTEHQVSALLAAASETTPKGYRDRALLELLYATGLRVTELVMLPLKALDLAGGTLSVGSGGESRRLDLTPRAVEALRLYLEKGRVALKAPADSGPLFVNPRGLQLTRQGVWLILKYYVKKAGIETAVTPHSLRHAFAAHRLRQGEPVQELQRLLGHAHLSTTMMYSRQYEPES